MNAMKILIKRYENGKATGAGGLIEEILKLGCSFPVG